MIVSGNLGNKATIKLISLGGTSECLRGFTAIKVTTDNGSYSMSVIDGVYGVEVMYDDSYEYIGVMTVDGSNVSSPL